MNKAIIGRKVGMTQIFTAEGKVIPVTVVEAGPCPVVQIKTVEKLIIQELYNSESSDHRVHTAFARVLDHFSDEDYLHKIGHQRIITTIYINHFYKYKKTKALNQELYIDTKTLLNYRKSYVRLFAKYYLNLVGEPEDTLLLLHAELLKRTANSKKDERA